MPLPPIKVLIIDDSPIVQKILTQAISKEEDIEVVGVASDPFQARDKIFELNPDVLTLDINMPRMDGLTFLKILMDQKPIPSIVLSSFTQEGSKQAFQALQLGAFEVLGKPQKTDDISLVFEQLIEQIKAARNANQKNWRPHLKQQDSSQTPPDLQALDPNSVIVIGASTGGTEAIKEILTKIPKNMPGIAVVQHMPAYFSKLFAERLNKLTDLEVKEPQDGEMLLPGQVFIAPGKKHMSLHRNNSGYFVQLNDTPPVWHQKPAVDILFKSAAKSAGKNAVGILLTGMGKDGAQGLLDLKQSGAYTLIQDEETSVVYGMPKEAKKINAEKEIQSIYKMSSSIICALNKKK